MKKGVVLLSGGIDSATTLFLAKEKGYNPRALIFNYGQKNKKEVGCAKKIAKKTRTPYTVIKLPFSWKGSALLDSHIKIPSGRSLKEIGENIPSTYVPARNLVFLSVAASLAESVKAEGIFIGAHAEDYSGYPDCTKEFFESFRKTLIRGTKEGRRIKIYTPLLKKDKTAIVKIGLRLGVPFEDTWSCYEGGKRPCGSCDSCIFRKNAFKRIGIPDPYFVRGR